MNSRLEAEAALLRRINSRLEAEAAVVQGTVRVPAALDGSFYGSRIAKGRSSFVGTAACLCPLSCLHIPFACICFSRIFGAPLRNNNWYNGPVREEVNHASAHVPAKVFRCLL
jgi:hypothetical protein